MRFGLACLALAAVLIVAAWAWLGAPVPMPQTSLTAGDKLYCASYAPFRGSQSPFDPAVHITPEQIDQDMAQLAAITDCVRTYSVGLGGDQVPKIAKRHGLKVILGIWIGRKQADNRLEIETGIRVANEFPDVVRAIVVGNEVLLRGELSPEDLAATIRTVKSQVKVPVTYADVWEFWLRNRDVASAVDFVTVHILPYWEDFPIAAKDAADHVEKIRRRVVAAFPGKEVIIGEFGWPSEGRMREGALPSLANEARVIQDVVALAKREKFRVNVIEAFDQPWKRVLEGTVGGYWGLLDGYTRKPKFTLGEPVSNHPHWQLQAGAGIAFALIVFGAAFIARRGVPPPTVWVAVTANAVAGGVLIGWIIAGVVIEAYGFAGWAHSFAFAAVALLSPPVLSAAVMRETPLPRLSALLGPTGTRVRDPLALLAGWLLIAVMLLALSSALGLVFDPRYRNFPFAPVTAAVVPFLTHSLTVARPYGRRGAAELAGAGLLALSVPYIAINETFANWQSLWLCAAFAALAVSLVRVRAVQS